MKSRGFSLSPLPRNAVGGAITRKSEKDSLCGTCKTGMIEILSRVRIGTLDWETERVSPRPLRSQFKLYQPVENSVNENRTCKIDLQGKFPPMCVIRITDAATRMCLHMVSRAITSRDSSPMSSDHSSSRSKFTYKIVAEDERTLVLSICGLCGACKKCSKLDGSLEKWEKSHRCNSEKK